MQGAPTLEVWMRRFWLISGKAILQRSGSAGIPPAHSKDLDHCHNPPGWRRTKTAAILLLAALSLAQPASLAQLVALPGILEGEQLKRINDIYGEVTSSATGQAGKLIPAFLDSLSTVDQRAMSQTYHQMRELLNDPSVLEALVQALKTNRAELASNILYSCRSYGSNAADYTTPQIQELAASLSNPNATVRKNICSLLMNVSPPNDTSIQTALIQAMVSDPSAQVRQAAANSLGHFGREVYFKNATPIAEAYAKVLAEDSNAQVRSAAASGLSQMGGKATPAAKALCKALTDNSSQVRSQVLQSIINVGPPCAAAIPELIDMWNAPNDPYMHNSKDRLVQAFAAIGTDAAVKAIPLMATQLKEHNSVNAVAGAFAKMGPDAAPAVPQLVKALDTPYCYDRECVARALGAIGPAAKPAVEALKKACRDDRTAEGSGSADSAKRSAREALFKITGEAPNINNSTASNDAFDR